MKKITILLIACLVLSGCVSTVPLLVRRSIVSDDVVYVKPNNTLYKRYLHDGMLLKGNPRMLETTGGNITDKNDNIVIYKDFEAAKDDLDSCTLDESLIELE